MATPWGLMCLFIGLNILEICQAHPMEQSFSGKEDPNGQIMGALVAAMISICIVFVLFACVCCKRRSGFKVFRNSPISASVINETSLSGEDPGHVNPIANAEFTIFTPLSPPHHNNNVFRSQPPVICYTTENETAPEFNKAVNPQIDGIDVSEWFADTEHDFPRSRLKYTRELGTGWFGRVVEGEAHGISSADTLSTPTWTPVAVRILESSAPAHEQAQFLHEAALYRIGAHPNILRLLGRSLEATPLLLIQEYCPKGDLKKFLIENRECKDSELMAGVPLRYCCQLASAVEFLHERNLPHLDLAARSCQISPDLSLKLGDYGLAVSHYPNDYYQGTPSIPVRWCAPESVNHTNTTLQPKQITLEANIWSLAVTFWEICEWGRSPYDWLTDDEVVSQVMGTHCIRLPQPTLNAYYIPPLYRLMEYCWLPSPDRPQINQIYSMLVHLSKTYTSTPSTQPETNFSMENFDMRWESLKPNTIIKTDNARTKSASLTNLHGSFENLADTVIQMDSWLENVATHTGDIEYVRGLSEAIHELDTALASEQTSSSSSFEPTPLSSLGAARSETILHTDDSNLDSLIFPKRSESGSETEDETWKRRIERGAYSEKVKQKSKSVADLMVLTHIDMNTVRDIFQEEIKKLHEERRESLLFVPVQSSDQISQISDVNNTENKADFINSLRGIEPSSGLSLESQMMKSEKESNLFKSLDVIETQINKTVPSVSKLEESNQTEAISNKNNFDTFIQQEPVLNLDTIESKNIVEAVNNQNINSDTLVEDNKTEDFIDNERKIEPTAKQKEITTNVTKSETIVKSLRLLNETEEIINDEAKLEDNIVNTSQIQLKNDKLEFEEAVKHIAKDKIDEIISEAVLIAQRNELLEENISNTKNNKNDETIESQNTNILKKMNETVSSEIKEPTIAQKVEKTIKTEETIGNINKKLEESTTIIIPESKQNKELLEIGKSDEIREAKIISAVTENTKILEKITEDFLINETFAPVQTIENKHDEFEKTTEVHMPELLQKVEEMRETPEEKKSTTVPIPELKQKEKLLEMRKYDEIEVVKNNSEEITANSKILKEITEDFLINETVENKQQKLEKPTSAHIPDLIQKVEEMRKTPEKNVTEETSKTSENKRKEFEEPITLNLETKQNEKLLKVGKHDEIEEVEKKILTKITEVNETAAPVQTIESKQEKLEKITTAHISELIQEVEETPKEKLIENRNEKLEENTKNTKILKKITEDFLVNETHTLVQTIESDSKKIEKPAAALTPELIQEIEKYNEIEEIKENTKISKKITEDSLVGGTVAPLETIESKQEKLEKPTTAHIPELIQKIEETKTPKEKLFQEETVDNVNKKLEESTTIEITESKQNEKLLKIGNYDEIDEVKKEPEENIKVVKKITENFLINEAVESNNKKIEEPSTQYIPELIQKVVETRKTSEEITENITLASKKLLDTPSNQNNESQNVNAATTVISNIEPKTQSQVQILEITNDKNQEIIQKFEDIIEVPNVEDMIEVTNVDDTIEAKLNVAQLRKENTVINEEEKKIVEFTEVIPKEIDDNGSNKEDNNLIETVHKLGAIKSEEIIIQKEIIMPSQLGEISAETINNKSSGGEVLEKLEEIEISKPPKEKLEGNLNINKEMIDKFEFTEPITVLPDLIETIKKDTECEISNKLIDFDDFEDDASKEMNKGNKSDNLFLSPSIRDKTEEFINNERNNNQEDTISHKVENNLNVQSISSDLTSDLLDTSNVQQMNQVFNVFNVTVDHKPPLECFSSPVKSYYSPFKQNEIMTDINSLLESENKYESKNSVCTSSLQKDFLPLVNGVSSEVSSRIIDILNQKEDNCEPQKLLKIVSDNKVTNGHEERPKKLSEIVLDSLKTNSISEDSGFASVQCEEKNLLKISADSLDDILSNSDENLVDKFEIEDYEVLHEPKKLSEIASESLKNISASPDEMITSFFDTEIVNLPDLILDNVQDKTLVIEPSEEILTNIEFEETKSAISLLSENILDSLPCNSPVTSESTDNVSDKTVIEIKNCDEDKTETEIDLNSPKVPTSTPFKSNLMPKKPDDFFSFVSEGDEPSDCQTRVILGPCEEYGLGLYSGLKTTFGKFSDDDRPEEEVLQFSSNFMPFTENEITQNSVDYSLETWDKFLGKSLQDQDDCASSVFDNFSPREDSSDVFSVKKVPEELNKTVILTDKKNDETFTIENETTVDTNVKETEQVETSQSSWEPGEGWFLHPQTSADELSGQIDISGSENIDNSYVGFALDEECVNALRNELAAKLPHAQGLSHEEPQEPEEWDNEERSEIIVKYNVYATPLSPIPEESCCDDVYCDQIQHRDGSDSESEWSEPGLGQTSQEEDILVVDTETHTALILESPSLREPQHRHTPSQDSCCSNDTLFNLEDLNYGHSPQHQASTTAHSSEPDSDHLLEIEITEDTPKQSPTIPKIETEDNLNSDSTEMNLTYTKPDINITESESDTKANKLELNLDPNTFGVAPLPSPEDIPWRQLPASLLTYNEVIQDQFEMQEDETTDTIENVDQEEDNEPPENTNEDLSDRECTLEIDLYSNLTDIRFSGPCDAQLMSTSFSESADYAEDKDWDSGSDTRSSSSGEFIWKEGEHEESLRALHAASHDVSAASEVNPMDAIEEENSNSSEDSDDCEEDMEETEFVPSAWDAQATPTKSAMRSPEKSSKRKNQQKGVWFKKQKYHCVYEYPREPESPVAPPTDLWRPLADLSTFADWELDPESCVAPSFDDTSDSSYDVLDKFITRNNYPLSRNRDLYQLNPFPDFNTGLTGSDEDFFISSSARPFQAIGQSSQFFPGQPSKSKFLWQEYQSSQQSSRDLSEGITPDSGIDDVTPDTGLVDLLPRNQKVPPLKCLAAIAANKNKTEQKNLDSSLGGLRHTRNRLKLDLPPSPNSFTSSRTFSIDIPNDPVINREIPTFTTFGKSRFSVQHVATPTDENSDPLQGIPKPKNVSFEALPHKPMAITEKVYILDKSEESNHKPVEMVQGEASLLDSADEDSGIESSANATLERHQQQILN